jgi:hypothetical protein
MPELAGRHPAEESRHLRHPADVGHEGDGSPGSEMLEAHFEVLPQRGTGQSLEGTDDQDEPYIAARGVLNGGQEHVPVFLSM